MAHAGPAPQKQPWPRLGLPPSLDLPSGPSPRGLPRATPPAGPAPASRGSSSSTWPQCVAARRTFRFGVTFSKRKLRRPSVAHGGCAGQRGPRGERPKRSHRCSRRRLNASENDHCADAHGTLSSSRFTAAAGPHAHQPSLALPAHHQPPQTAGVRQGAPPGGGPRGLAEGHGCRRGGRGGSPSSAGLSSWDFRTHFSLLRFI